jgi:hypothetical protein
MPHQKQLFVCDALSLVLEEKTFQTGLSEMWCPRIGHPQSIHNL